MIKVAINGFGRIGRTLLRILQSNKKINVVAINDMADIATIAHLLKYDSVHGKFPDSVQVEDGNLKINDRIIKYSQQKIDDLNWSDVDVVVECTGVYKNISDLNKHIFNGAKKVILSAPPGDDNIPSVCLGINEDVITSTTKIISNASCTTNSAAPLIKVLSENWGIESAYITTIHSYTSDQRLHDAPHKDLRRARAANLSIVPTTTGAAKAITKIFPDLNNKIGGCGIRVPVPDGSLTDISCIVNNSVTIEEINNKFKQESENSLKGILEYCEDPIVGVDIIGNTNSSIFDAGLTSVVGKMVKVVGWYDNEYGYSSRLAELINKIHYV